MRPPHAYRKFALLVHVDGYGPLVLGKTCRYCTRCELIIAHQDELEAELVNGFEQIPPNLIIREYLVLGVVDKKFWRENLNGGEQSLDNALAYMADSKQRMDLKVENGGWLPE